MLRFAALALAVVLAVPASAQRIPDEFPEPGESPADRNRRDLAERFRPFLSHLYVESTLAAGPSLGTPATLGAAVVEGGYRFDNGDAVALVTSVQAPIVVDAGPVDPLGEASAAVGAQYAIGLRRLVPEAAVLRRAEVGLGAGAVFFADASVWSVEVAPKVVLPLTPVLSLPVGVRVSREVGGALGRGTFVGLSVGLRRVFADEARMVLE